MLVEKKAPVKGKVNINNNVVLTDAGKSELTWGTGKQNVLRVSFEFRTLYEPKIADITLNGELLYYDKVEKIDELDKQWKKEKKLSKEVTGEILNHLLSKCNIEAMILSRETGLPPPIPLPKVQVK